MQFAQKISQQSAAFCIIALLVLVVCQSFERLPINAELWIAAVLIGVLGVPHGALDTLYGARIYALRGVMQWAAFSASYIAMAAMVIALWWFLPLIFLTLFLLVSVLHFSGDLLSGAHWTSRFFYGAAIIVLPNYVYAEEVFRLFGFLVTDSTSARGLRYLSDLLSAAAIPWAITLVLCALLESRQSLRTAFEMLAVAAIALWVPPLIAFTVFFCAQHGARHVLRTLDEVRPTARISLSISVGMVMLVVALCAIVAYFFSRGAAIDANALLDVQLVQIVFVGLAALTVPHMALIERARYFG